MSKWGAISYKTDGKQTAKWQKSYPICKIILNVNKLDSIIKGQILAGWITHDPTICCQETHLRSKYKHKLKVKVWKNMIHANNNQKKVEMAILISHKVDFK